MLENSDLEFMTNRPDHLRMRNGWLKRRTVGYLS